jgi:peptidoglycan/xylan/chitin deacetylase (PgdA/CDA1 family)
MSGLPEAHDQYPRRRAGMDHDRYDWAILPHRAPRRWPNGAHLAVWLVVPLTWYPLDMAAQSRPVPGGFSDPYPNLRDYTHRDYGNRIGAFRIMQVLDRYAVRATAPTNAAICTRYPALVAEGVRRGWEFAGHGVDMGQMHDAGLSEAAETGMVAASLTTLREATGQKVAGWVSPGQSESLCTPDVLAEHGVTWLGDWANDDLPYRMQTRSGTLHALPCSAALQDTIAIWQSHHSAAEFTRQAIDQFDWLHRESRTQGCRVMTLVVNGWCLGQPHRIRALDAILAHVMRHDGVWMATGEEIVAGFAEAEKQR